MLWINSWIKTVSPAPPKSPTLPPFKVRGKKGQITLIPVSRISEEVDNSSKVGFYELADALHLRKKELPSQWYLPKRWRHVPKFLYLLVQRLDRPVSCFHSTKSNHLFDSMAMVRTISQLQGYFKDDFVFLSSFCRRHKCIVNLRKVFPPAATRHVYNGTDNLSNFTWTRLASLFI